MTEHVKIIEDSNGFVTALDCHLYPDKKIDTIIWENSTDHDYRVTFRECPFDKNDFWVSAKGKSDEVHLNPGAQRKVFTYLLHPASAKAGDAMAADPNVIVH